MIKLKCLFFTLFVPLALRVCGFIDDALIVHQVLHLDNIHGHNDLLELKVVLYRIPLGQTLWWITIAKLLKQDSRHNPC